MCAGPPALSRLPDSMPAHVAAIQMQRWMMALPKPVMPALQQQQQQNVSQRQREDQHLLHDTTHL